MQGLVMEPRRERKEGRKKKWKPVQNSTYLCHTCCPGMKAIP